jgi:molybdopterin-guanine dinucleotide biosynthesis protein A
LLQRVIDRLEGLATEYVIVKAGGQQLPAFHSKAPARVVEDIYPDSGPLGGIYTGLSSCQAPYGVAVACDMPLLQPALLAELFRLAPHFDLVVPLGVGGLPEPLCAAYSKRCLEPIRRQLAAGEFKVTGFYALLGPRFLQPEEWREFDPEGLSFQNLNRQEDRERIESLLRAGASGT